MTYRDLDVLGALSYWIPTLIAIPALHVPVQEYGIKRGRQPARSV